MPSTRDQVSLARMLPGTWRIGATNFPLWLGGDRHHPSFTYGIKREEPLVLDDTVSYLTDSGATKTIVGVDRLKHDGFVWRGSGLLLPFTSNWRVAGTTEDQNIMTVRFSKSIATPAGVDVVIREGTDSHAFRTIVANSSDELGLTAEEFATLSWLELDRTGDAANGSQPST